MTHLTNITLFIRRRQRSLSRRSLAASRGQVCGQVDVNILSICDTLSSTLTLSAPVFHFEFLHANVHISHALVGRDAYGPFHKFLGL